MPASPAHTTAGQNSGSGSQFVFTYVKTHCDPDPEFSPGELLAGFSIPGGRSAKAGEKLNGSSRMIIEVKVPQLSESVAEATLLDWHKKEGERVARDENLIDIETDKVVLELPAPADGVLVKILKNARDAVGSGDVIAQIDTEGKAASPAKAAAPAAPTPQQAKA